MLQIVLQPTERQYRLLKEFLGAASIPVSRIDDFREVEKMVNQFKVAKLPDPLYRLNASPSQAGPKRQRRSPVPPASTQEQSKL